MVGSGKAVAGEWQRQWQRIYYKFLITVARWCVGLVVVSERKLATRWLQGGQVVARRLPGIGQEVARRWP